MTQQNVSLPGAREGGGEIKNIAQEYGTQQGSQPLSVAVTNTPQPGNTTSNVIAPGSSGVLDETRSEDIEIEGLGLLSDIPKQPYEEDEGNGDKTVILHDLVKGFVKGRVIRISRLCPDWDNEDKTETKLEVKRLFDLGAIRLATREEQEMDIVRFDSNDNLALQRERAMRINAEKELDKLRSETTHSFTGTDDDDESTDTGVGTKPQNIRKVPPPLTQNTGGSE